MSKAATSRGTIWSSFSRALSKSRGALANGLGDLLMGRKTIDAELLTHLETLLLVADVGVPTTQTILARLTQRLKRRELRDGDALMHALRAEVGSIAGGLVRPFHVGSERPFVIVTVGVNGVGKTTTIAKLAHRIRANGNSVLLAAGDTYRAAAIEQLQEWGRRLSLPVIAQRHGADSASVIFDAIEAARAREIDVVIADTAGRLQTKTGLMDELEKVIRVIKRLDQSAPQEVLLVLDAGVGQNAMSQLTEFQSRIGVTGMAVTKLDGTAKAGVVLSLANAQDIPLYFVGLGERLEDLHPFDPDAFTRGLLGQTP